MKKNILEEPSFRKKEKPTQWARGIVATSFFLLDLHGDIDRLRIEIEVKSLYDIFFQKHNDVVVITVAQCKTSSHSDTNFQCRTDIR